MKPVATMPKRPSQRAPTPQRPQRSDAEAAAAAAVPVLVIDDDAASAKLVAILLREEDCDVRVASSAEEALVILQSFAPKLIVLDLVLPLMSGFLLAQQLKADPRTAGIAIVAVSAFNGAEAKRAALSAGCAEYIRKPIDALTVGAAILAHLPTGS